MFARYYFHPCIVIAFAAVLVGALPLRAQDQTINGNLTVTGTTNLQGTLDVTQGVTVIGDTDLMGNLFSIGHSLNADNITQNYSVAGLEIYVKNTNFTTRLIEHVTTVDGTTFKWGTRAATDLNANGILDDFGTSWLSLTATTLTLPGNLLVNGTDNQLTAQTLTGVNSILTRGLADARYLQLTNTAPLTISNTTAATSSTTGALIIAGGIGVAKDSWINGVRLGRGLAAVASNTALGAGTLNTNTTGSNNTASGLNSLYANTTGANNSATGVNALRFNTTGGANTASGVNALYANTSGSNNEASGYQALKNNTTGSYNTVSGFNAANFHANGTTVLTDPEGSVYLGAETRALNNSDSNSIVIAGRTATARGVGEGANTTVLGNSATTSTKLFGALSQAGGTVTTSKPHNFTQTWNAGAVLFTGIQSNITDTASAAGSLLLDLQVGGVSKFSVDKAGNIAATNLTVAGLPVLTQAAAASTYLTTASATSSYLAKTTFDPDSDGKIDTAQLTGVAPLTVTNTTVSTSSTTGALIVSGGLGVAKDSWINGVRVGLGLGAITSNTALGNGALNANTTGGYNTVNGFNALYSNTTGGYNTATGTGALQVNATGSYNTAIGVGALYSNTNGNNTATGAYALGANTIGAENTATGAGALGSNTTGSGNIAIGSRAGQFQADDTTGLIANSSVYIGAYSKGLNNSDSNSIVIGYGATSEGANTTVIGNSSTTSAHIYGLLNVSGLNISGQPVLTQAAAASTYLTTASATTTYLAKTTFDPDSDGKIDTAQLTGVAPLSVTNTTAATSSTTGALIVSGGLGVATDAYINTVKVGLGGGNIASNTVLGNLALGINTTGVANVAIGAQTLYYNTTGNHNTANGCLALFQNATGNFNTASGYGALGNNSTGNSNTASGQNALFYNTSGSFNTASGDYVLHYNTTGSQNIAFGVRAGLFQADGITALATANNSVYLGAYSRGFDNSDNNAIVIGYNSIGEGANTTVIGNSSTTSAHIYGQLNVSGLNISGQPVLTQAAAASTYLTTASATTTYLAKTTYDPDSDGKIDTAQITGVAPLSVTNTTAATSSTTGALIVSGGLGVAKDSWINGIRVGLGAGGITSNTALGNGALNVNTTGDGSVAVGTSSLGGNTTGAWNTAVGFQSLAANSTGYWNMAIGFQALFSNTTGASNSAAGFGALSLNSTGYHNTASGYYALRFNTTGAANTAFGSRSLYSITTGNSNIAFGKDAGQFQADGVTALATANNSVYLGAGTRGFNDSDNNSIVIGANAIGEGANATVIGNSSTTSAHIYGQLNVSGLNVAGQPVLTQAAAATIYLTPAQADVAYLTPAQAATGYIQNGSSGILLGTLVNGATGNISIALGQYSYASDRSVSIGFEAGSNGNGYPVSGQESVAIGRQARAPGMFATAVGRSTWVEGAESIGLGHGSYTRELGGVALGRFAASTQVGQVALGSFNVESPRSSTPAPTDDLFIIGNGNGIPADPQEKSNAFVIKRNGDTEIKGAASVQGSMDVQQNASVQGNLNVQQNATITGQLIISNPAGGISMGEFGNP